MLTKKRYFFLTALVMLFGFTIFSTYREVKSKTIAEFNTQQLILAKQAAKGIESFFHSYYRDLSYLSEIDDLVSFNDQGKKLMETFYHSNAKEIRAITRVDGNGRIIYTVPFNEKAVGTDISYQNHVRVIIQTHRPVVSDVFTAVQGYKAVAYHVPVFMNGKYKGSIAVLIPFESLSKEYLENIKIGKEGSAWLISQKGVELYSPVSSHIGKTVLETYRKFPSVISMAAEMMKGKEGIATYTYDEIRKKSIVKATKHAAYSPIRLGNTFWSIAVAASEREVLATMKGFRNKLSLIVALLLSAGIIYSYFPIKAWAILQKEEMRKRAEETLRASHERFLTVLDSIDATIYVAEIETYEILFMNKNMKKNFGRDMTGEICWKVFRGESKPCRQCPNNQLIDKNGKPAGVYVWQDRNPITGKWYINYDRAIEWTDGRLVRIQIATDITDFKSMEEELRQAHKMESIGTLAGGIAHDFNNILGIILGNAELALDDVPEWNPTRYNLEEIRLASLRAKDVVRQLLSFARKTKLEKKPTNITPIIKESLKLLRSSIPTSIEIRRNIEEDVDTIIADPTQINQVLINLCTNAEHAMPDGGIIEVTLENVKFDEGTVAKHPGLNPGRYVSLMVSDTGHGIPKEEIDRIFDPYFTTKEVGKGTGMGLAVVHGIVKEHNGVITVESEFEKGTTLSIFFPSVEKKAVGEIKNDEKLPTGNEKILFIDDEESIVELSRQGLERLGYEVEATTSPVEALALFRSKPDQYDLVITDLAMPQMTGDKLVNEILNIRSDLPIIICTGFSEKIDEKKAKAIGAADYIEKPIDKRAFAFAVRQVLNGIKG